MAFDKTVSKSIVINALVSKIWQTLITPDLIKLWLSDSGINVRSNWQVGGPFELFGTLHDFAFYDKGTILQFEPEKILQYSNLSGISNLVDIPENYSIITFTLTTADDHVLLALNQTNFATENMYQHWNFYWNGTLHKLKRIVEQS